MNHLNIFGAEVRWLCRLCKTRLSDEIDCIDGWFKNIPLLKNIENIIIAIFIIVLMAISINILFIG